MITEKEVKHIAKLARLGLTKKEIEKFQKELSLILDYIDKLKEVEIENVEPYSLFLENVFREDFERVEIEKAKKIFEMAPEKKGGFFKVKSILK
jgi:aspartyl-tRNA(Asn)/glutamyl-tRNA(Gln) amidotransferase subunit C